MEVILWIRMERRKEHPSFSQDTSQSQGRTIGRSLSSNQMDKLWNVNDFLGRITLRLHHSSASEVTRRKDEVGLSFFSKEHNEVCLDTFLMSDNNILGSWMCDLGSLISSTQTVGLLSFEWPRSHFQLISYNEVTCYHDDFTFSSSFTP